MNELPRVVISGGGFSGLAYAQRRTGRPFRPLPGPTLLPFGEMGCILLVGQKAVFSPTLDAAQLRAL